MRAIRRSLARSHGCFSEALGLEGLDLVGVAQRQADVVEAVEQAVLAKRLRPRTAVSAPSGLHHDLALQIDGQAIADEGHRLVEQLRDLDSLSTIGSSPFLKQLLKKMSAKLGAMMARKPYWSQRPRRVLARRAAAEVLARQQDRGALVARLVQHEVRIRPARLPGPARARRDRGSARRRTGSGRSPSCLIDFRNCLGMMASVSTFSRSMRRDEAGVDAKGVMSVRACAVRRGRGVIGCEVGA